MEELINSLRANNLIDEMGNIVLEKSAQQIMTVDVETFTTFFGDKEITYDNLIGSHTFNWNGETLTKSAEELGYKKYFEELKMLAII